MQAANGRQFGVKPETAFSDRVRKALERAGAYVIKKHGSRYGVSGQPDLIVFSRQWTGALELKVGNNQLTQIQRLALERITAAGGSAYVLRLSQAIVIESWWGAELVRLPARSIDGAALLDALSNLAKQTDAAEWMRGNA